MGSGHVLIHLVLVVLVRSKSFMSVVVGIVVAICWLIFIGIMDSL